MLPVIFMQTQDIYIQSPLLSKLFCALLFSLNKKYIQRTVYILDNFLVPFSPQLHCISC